MYVSITSLVSLVFYCIIIKTVPSTQETKSDFETTNQSEDQSVHSELTDLKESRVLDKKSFYENWVNEKRTSSNQHVSLLRNMLKMIFRNNYTKEVKYYLFSMS